MSQPDTKEELYWDTIEVLINCPITLLPPEVQNGTYTIKEYVNQLLASMVFDE